jgi:hypothetical protein
MVPPEPADDTLRLWNVTAEDYRRMYMTDEGISKMREEA